MKEYSKDCLVARMQGYCLNAVLMYDVNVVAVALNCDSNRLMFEYRAET